MALSVSGFGKLSPEIQLAQAISEFEAVLLGDEKASLRQLKARHPPSAIDVVRLTAEIDRTAQTGRRCVGTRFTSVLQAIQSFAAIGDVVVGGTQNMMASGLWALMRFTLQLATNYASFLEKFSELFLDIGRSAPRYQNLGLIYPQSSGLQKIICEYFTVLVQLCTKSVRFMRRNGLNRLLATTMRSFDSEFGSHVKKLDTLGMEIKESVMVLSAKTQQDEVRENSLFRSLLLSKLDKNEEARRKLAVKLSILDKCSTYDFESSWRQMRKKGNSSWIFDTPEYISWRDIPCVGGNRTLLCLGKLGSGKTVLAANVVQDLITCFPQEKVFAYFFCRYDVAESLNARTILGSLARQLLESTDMANSYDFFAQSTQKHPHALSLDGIFSLLNYIIWENARVKHVFLLVDGLDNCEDTEKKLAIQHLKTLAKNGIVRLFLTTRSELESTAVLVEKSFPQQTKVHMLDQTNEINAYIDGELDRRLESGALCLTNPEIIVEIQATLKANAHGMFLWVVLQLDSICDEETDEAILTALRDLPPDLPAVYERILEKNKRSNYKKIILQLVSSAYRPLTMWALQEALSVTPGETTMDRTKFVNNIQKTISCCGSLLELDEEALTVHFVHPSAKQHLLLSDSENAPSSSSRFTQKEAATIMGTICVTYLNWSAFENQLIPQYLPWLTDGSTTLNAVVNPPFQSKGFAKKVAQMYLQRTRRSSSLSESSSFDFKRVLMDAYSKVEQKHPMEGFHFLPYAKQYWLHHTKEFNKSMGKMYTLWERLINNPPTIIGNFPWDNSLDSSTEDAIQRRLDWAFRYRHHALASSILYTDRARFLHFSEERESYALQAQVLGLWDEAAQIRCQIVDFLKLDNVKGTLDVLRAIWNLALSYQAIEEEQDKVGYLLKEFVLQLKMVNSPFVDGILDSSVAFQKARNNIRHAKIAEKLLESAFSLSQVFLGDRDINTQRLLYDVKNFEERRSKNLAL